HRLLAPALRRADPLGLLGQRAGPHVGGPVRVTDDGGRVTAGEGADHGDHAAVVLEVVVGVGDVVFAGVDVLGGHGDAAVDAFEVGAGGAAVQLTAVGVAAPG